MEDIHQCHYHKQEVVRYFCISKICQFETRYLCIKCRIEEHYLNHGKCMLNLQDLQEKNQSLIKNWPQNKRIFTLFTEIKQKQQLKQQQIQISQLQQHKQEFLKQIEKLFDEQILNKFQQESQNQENLNNSLQQQLEEAYNLQPIETLVNFPKSFIKSTQDEKINQFIEQIEKNEKSILPTIQKYQQQPIQKNPLQFDKDLFIISGQKNLIPQIQQLFSQCVVNKPQVNSDQAQEQTKSKKPEKSKNQIKISSQNQNQNSQEAQQSASQQQPEQSQKQLIQSLDQMKNTHYDQKISLKKIQRGKFTKELKKFSEKKINLEKFQYYCSIQDQSIDYLSQHQKTLTSQQIDAILIKLNFNLSLHRGFCSKQQEINQFNQLINSIKEQNPSQFNSISFHLLSESEQITLQWHKFPKQLIPEMMNMTLYSYLKIKQYKEAVKRLNHGKKKRMQIQYLLYLIENLIKQQQTSENKIKHIVDFAGGRGDYSLVLAYLFPDIKVTVADIRKQSLMQVMYRAKQIKLKNVRVYCGDIAFFEQQFDLGIGLHSCGGLCDIILDKCLEQKAHFIICTCCFGKIKFWKDSMKYPRFLSSISEKDYFEICKIAENDELLIQQLLNQAKYNINEYNKQNQDKQQEQEQIDNDQEEEETKENTTFLSQQQKNLQQRKLKKQMNNKQADLENQNDKNSNQSSIGDDQQQIESLLQQIQLIEPDKKDLQNQFTKLSKLSKQIINCDRLFCLQNNSTYFQKISNFSIIEIPEECSTKNQVLCSFKIN